MMDYPYHNYEQVQLVKYLLLSPKIVFVLTTFNAAIGLYAAIELPGFDVHG
jgi:hypothetical protein